MMLKDFGRRSVTSAILIALLALLLIFADNFYVMGLLLLVGCAFVALAAWEYAHLARKKGAKIPASIPGIAAFLALLLCIGPASFALFFFFLVLIYLFVSPFREVEGSLFDISASSFGLTYVAVPLGMLLAILYRGPDDGRMWIAYLLLATKMTDIGAYFIGSLLGKRKLLERVSPSKSVEGAIAGLLCCLAVSYLFHLIGWLGSLEWILLGAALGVMAQIGDLTESLLKRDAMLKDSNSLPGLGGALDTVDSLLFNAPILYFYLNL